MIAENEPPANAVEPPRSSPVHRALLIAAKAAARPAAAEIGEGDDTNEEDNAPALRSAAALRVPAASIPAPAAVRVQRVADASPKVLGWVKGRDAAPISAARTAAAPVPTPRPHEEARKSEARVEETRVAKSDEAHAGADGGWVIQIGASDNADKANELLIRAREHNRATLASAKAVTEKVKKGEGVFYRARFAGLDSDSAEQACRSLKRTGFSCFAAHD